MNKPPLKTIYVGSYKLFCYTYEPDMNNYYDYVWNVVLQSIPSMKKSSENPFMYLQKRNILLVETDDAMFNNSDEITLAQYYF